MGGCQHAAAARPVPAETRFQSGASRFSIGARENEMARIRHRRAWWPAAIAGPLLGLLLALPSAASARKLQMSGTWAMRRSQAFLPLQFAESKMGTRLTHTSGGSLSKALLFPNGPVPGAGVVSATGSGPATLVVPPHRFGGMFSTQLPLAGLTLIQVATALTADGPAAAAVLAASGGPGSFTWCPDDPACSDAPGTLDPPGPSGGGRIVYRAGANRFGGVMQMLLQGHVGVSLVFATSPFQALHESRGPTAALDSGIQHTGGSYANVVLDYLPRLIATQPLATPTVDGLITAPGPKVTTMFGVTTAPGMPHPTLFGPTLLTTPMGFKAGEVRAHTGFPFTTGTVIAQQAIGTGGDDFFTLMGSDMRTALGAGNIALVAGGIATIHNPYRDRFASFGVVRMTLAPPVPSLSPAGVGAAWALFLLAVGYARRRSVDR